MNSAKLNDWMQVAGIFAVVASLIFVGLQMRQEQDIAVAQIWAMSDQSVAEISGLVTENRDLWVKGLKGEELSENDQVAFRTIAWAVFRRAANISHRVERLQYGSTPERRARRLSYDLYESPGLRSAFEEFRAKAEKRDSALGDGGNFDETFNLEVAKGLIELDRSSPPVTDNLFVPF
jgi:hypothetical protein